jgi:23S rRNA G2445 N2-methylase RlmL
MKYYALVNLGLEEVAKKEIQELLSVASDVRKGILEFDSEKTENLQSIKRLLLAIVKTKKIEQIQWPEFSWTNHFSARSFKIEVAGVKGQENRIKIAKIVAESLFNVLKAKKIDTKLELKKPDFLVVVFFNGEEYFLGIDKTVEELNSRPYRVFAHQASFKGDFAYYFVRKSGYKRGDKLCIALCKDGAIAIEAARFSKEKVYAFDETRQNVTAARKNIKLAKQDVEVQQCDLDELDVKYDKKSFDSLIAHITSKDEEEINELYYQADYVLKKGGRLLIIGRENWDLSISEKFHLKDKGEIKKGECIHKYWLLETMLNQT